MNKIILIGNLTRDPELKSTPMGKTVCSFDIAVNSRNRQQTVQYFHIDAWGPLGENCKRYLSKGRKVFVSGPVSARIYQVSTGETRVSLDVTADDVEFISPRDEPAGYAQQQSYYPAPSVQSSGDMTPVETDDLPF